MTKRLHPDTDTRLIGRPSPFVEPTNATHLEKWRSLGFRLDGAPLSALEDMILTTWGELSPAAEREGDVIDTGQLYDAIERAGGTEGRSAAWLRKKITIILRELADAGVLGRHRVRNGAPGVAWRYELRSPEETASSWSDGPIDGEAKLSKSAKHRRDALHEVLLANTLIRPAMDIEEPWSYLLVTQLMERCSRAKQTDPRTHLSSSVVVDGEVVSTEASATLWGLDDPSHGIVVADDAQLILALLTTAMQKISRDIEAGLTPTNQISVDLLQIAKQLNSGNELSTYRAFQRSMARIANTEFRLSTEPGGKFAARISQMINSTADTIRFRLLSQVFEGRDGTQADLWEGDWEPSQGIRHVTFSLTPLIWQDLLSGHGWVVHPGLLYERSGLTHKIYNHLKAHSSSDHPYRVTGDHLMRYLQHAGEGLAKEKRKAGRFCDQLWRLFSQHATRTTGFLGMPVGTASGQQPLHLNLFDLELHVTPLADHATAMMIEARLSKESRWLLEKQEQVTRNNMKRLQVLEQGKPAGYIAG